MVVTIIYMIHNPFKQQRRVIFMKELTDKLIGDQIQDDNKKYALDKDGKPYKCGRKECENYVPFGKRKYCSNGCGTITNRKKFEEREKMDGKNNLIYYLIRKNMKPRICLGCRRTFISDGPWNRICSSCSERNASIYGKDGRTVR